MNYTSALLTILFFLGALISTFWGIYIIKLNPKQKVNKAFFALCSALAIWSFGFAMANMSGNMETAVFWRRFASLGMTLIFGIILHFLLLVTRQRDSGNLDKTIWLIHLPGLVCMYMFSFYTPTALLQYDLVKTAYGLTNMADNSIWNYVYYFYYGLYMFASLVTVWKWRRKIKEKKKIKQANFIFLAILGASLIASLTDIVWTTYMSTPLPQLAPLFILLPVWAMYYTARHHGLIIYERPFKENFVITEKERQKIFYILSIIFIFGAILNFLYEYSLFIRNIEGNFSFGAFKSFMFLLTGLVLYFVQKIKNSQVKYFITMFVLVVNIPIISLQFIRYFAISIWAFPMIIIIVSLVFSKKTLLILTSLTAIGTQAIMWRLNPQGNVYVENYDYILRMILFLTASLVGYYVNEIYVGKIEENDFQIRFQKMNASISSDFISINKENKDKKICNLLREMGLFFDADRTYVFLIDYSDNTMTYSYEWCKDGIEEEVGTIEKIPLSVFPWWIKQLKEKHLVLIEDVNTMPEEAKNEQDQLLRQGVKTLISVPVEGEKRMKAFIGIDSVELYRKWTDQDIKLLNILSNLLSDGLTRLKSEDKIQHMAYYDNLTNLPNRFLFTDRVKTAIKTARRTDSLISIMFIDLDNFKTVNDTIGHDGGDFLLKQVAKGLKDSVRETDTVARFGGDEFMILLSNIKRKEDIYMVANKIMDIFSKPFDIYGQEFFVTGSGGIALYDEDGDDPESLIKNADTAMYEAKAKGKNGYALCSSNMKEEVEKNMLMSKDLHYALERNELFLYYQPQMDLNNKEITGLEALLRWKHPKLGMIPPKTFIPLAEENGLINSIGEWVLETACHQNKKWQDMGLGKIKMGVNLSAIQLINAAIVDQVARVLEESGLEPHYLELEITENIAIKETDYVIEVLNKLKEIGVSIAIDDFGTEYSSLNRLKLLPIDRIKIDMAFIHGIENSHKDKAITAIIINMAKNLGMNVLAEGVETAPQQEFLNEKMCDYVQGFYYYKPMPADEMEKILREKA